MNPYCPIVEQRSATSAYEKILYQQLHDQWIKVTYHLKYTRYGRLHSVIMRDETTEDQFQAKDYSQMNVMLYILNPNVEDSGESVCPGSYQCPAITQLYIT